MSGWNIFYGLINFAILAGALYFIGRKLVANMFRKHREEVSEGLEASEQAAKNAPLLLEELPGREEQGRKALERIGREAEEAAQQRRELAAKATGEELEALAREQAGDEERSSMPRRAAAYSGFCRSLAVCSQISSAALAFSSRRRARW